MATMKSITSSGSRLEQLKRLALVLAKNIDYYENRWTESNPNGTQPALSGSDLEDAMQASSRHLYDASFLRLKTVTLGYSIPKSLLKKVNISNLRIYFTGGNLLTFKAYPIADPEVGDYGTRGWETPLGKSYTFGLDFRF